MTAATKTKSTATVSPAEAEAASTDPAPFDLEKIAQSVEAVDDDAMPPAIRRARQSSPFEPVVADAIKTKKRYVLKDRFSLKPYPGRKGANEAYTVMGQLHRAASNLGVKLQVRRFDVADDSCKVTFKVVNG